MPVIGTFTSSPTGYIGTIRTLVMKAKLTISAVEGARTDGSPDFRIFAGSCEVGAAWRRTRKDTLASYLSVRLDDPSMPEPINAVLMEAADDGQFRLLWRRDKKAATDVEPRP